MYDLSRTGVPPPERIRESPRSRAAAERREGRYLGGYPIPEPGSSFRRCTLCGRLWMKGQPHVCDMQASYEAGAREIAALHARAENQGLDAIIILGMAVALAVAGGLLGGLLVWMFKT